MAAVQDVTREEFELIKAMIERLGIQFEVLSRDNQYLHQRLADLSEAMNERFDQVDARFDQVDARFDQVDARFDRMDARFDRMEARTDARFAQVDARFEQVDGRFDRLETLITDGHSTLLALLKLTPH